VFKRGKFRFSKKKLESAGLSWKALILVGKFKNDIHCLQRFFDKNIRFSLFFWKFCRYSQMLALQAKLKSPKIARRIASSRPNISPNWFEEKRVIAAIFI